VVVNLVGYGPGLVGEGGGEWVSGPLSGIGEGGRGPSSRRYARSTETRLSCRRNITIVRDTVRVSSFWNRAEGMGKWRLSCREVEWLGRGIYGRGKLWGFGERDQSD
jgi:hypothetical protein